MREAVFANIWQRIDTGEQFLGMPWRKVRSYCDGAVLADQPPPYCTPTYRRIGVLRAYPKEQQ